MNIFVTGFFYWFMSLLTLSYIPSLHSSDYDIDFGKRVMMVTFFAFLGTVIERFLRKSLGSFILSRLFLCYRPKAQFEFENGNWRRQYLNKRSRFMEDKEMI